MASKQTEGFLGENYVLILYSNYKHTWQIAHVILNWLPMLVTFFTNAAQDDILIHPHYATQNILLGTSNSQIPSITVTSNAVGIFESYPSYTLDVQGDINFTGTFLQNGTPYIGSQWSNDNSNVFLLSSNVGIGLSNPVYPLDVNGDINFTGTFRKNGTPYVGSQWSNNNSNVFLGADSNVGIAMSNPYERFMINGNCLVASNDAYLSATAPNVSPSLGICKKSGSAAMFVFTSNYNNTFNNSLKFGMLTGTHLSNIATVSPVEYMVLTNSGNLGIGNSAPTYKLDVTGKMRLTGNVTSQNAGPRLQVNDFDGTEDPVTYGIVQITKNSGGISTLSNQASLSFVRSGNYAAGMGFSKGSNVFGFGAGQTSNVDFAPNWLCINGTNSNVGVGTTTPSYKLDVNGDINYTGTLSKSGVALVGSQWTSSACNVYVGSTSNVGIGTTAPGYTLHVVGTIYTSGDIIAFSDESAKSNLEVISEPLSKVRQLTGYTYNMPDSVSDTTKLTSKYTGLIAQQVMQVLPEAVHKDTDGKLSIAYGNIMGLVVEAIKSIDDKYKEEIQTLKNQMAQVMSKIENLYT